MKIVQLETIPYRLPLHGALAWGKHSRLDMAEHVLLRVHLENKIFGQAEAPPRPTIYGETIASIVGIVKFLEKQLLGLEIEDTASIANALASLNNNNTAKGGLDMACWDARAKAQGKNLFETLAGPQKKLPVSYILGIADQATMLEEAKRVFAAGVRVLKIKVGRNYQHDLEVIAALKTEFGNEMQLYADSNETLLPETAPKAMEAMAKAGIMFVEEPLPVRNIRARVALKKLGILPIIADDSCFTLPDLRRELDFDTFDILNIKTARNGFTESLAMLALAKDANKGVMIGSQASTGLGTIHAALMASQSAVNQPSELSFWLKLQSDILNKNLELQDGVLKLENLQGANVDENKLEAQKILP